MRSNWVQGGGRRPDYRRFTIVEISASNESVQSPALNPRKRLHSAEEVQCGNRPNPEGAGSVSVTELSHSENKQGRESLCQRCQIIMNELNRQALELAEPGTLKDPRIAAFLLDKLQTLEWPPRGCGAQSSCKVCGTPLHHLRRLALHSALGLALDDVPDLQPGPLSGLLPPRVASHNVISPHTSWEWPTQGSPTASGQHLTGHLCDPLPREKQQEMHLNKDEAARVGGKRTCLATVTPLPFHAQHYLEGVWHVTRSSDHFHTLGHTLEKDSLVSEASRSSQASAVHSESSSEHKPSNQDQPAILPVPQTSSAVSFFLRAAQKLNLSKRKKPQPLPPSPPDPEEPFFYTDGFSAALQLSPPPIPPCLLRAGSKVKDSPGMGKVKVMVRICPAKGSRDTSESMSFMKVDAHKKQLTLCEPPTNTRSVSATAPKMFTFDAVFTQDASQAEVCSGTVAEVIQSVVNGADGCIFCFGQANLGKTYTMIGRDSSTQCLGVSPCAISWLFKLIEERKEKAGTRFSVRVSAVEICGREELLRDLLADFSTEASQDSQSAEVALREDPVCGSQLQNQSELRAYSAERAAFLLDAALAARSTNRCDCKEEDRQNSHMLFTLHISQYRMEKSTKAGMSSGRSRLHLLDLGSCESDLSQTRDEGRGQCLSLGALGNVILALANGAKHVPYRDSKLTMLLRESLGNINCRTTMIAHISDSPANYAESLTTVQLASRIHRMRKKKSKYASSSSGGESSCEEGHIRRSPFHPRTVALDPDHPALLSNDPDYSSSSEHSCDTVIYVGPGGAPISDRELSDNEGPPAFVPIIPSLNKKRVKEGPKSDGDHFKCNTFAELQVRLECIDGSESSSVFTSEEKGQEIAPKSAADKVAEGTSVLARTAKSSLQKPVQLQHGDTSEANKTLQDTEPVVREKVLLNKRPIQKSNASTSLQNISRNPDCGLATQTPPQGMSRQVLRQGELSGSPILDRAHHLSRSPMEVSHLRAGLRNRCFDRDVLRTTVTLQQPVELNGEDELVFTVVEELPAGLVPDNGRPSSIMSFNSDCSLQALASGSRPVSIISSINDEFDAYTSQMSRSQLNQAAASESQEELTAGRTTQAQSSIRSWACITNICTPSNDDTISETSLSSKALRRGPDSSSMMDLPGGLHVESFSQQRTNSCSGGSGICFSELDYDTATADKLSISKCPLSHDSTKATLGGPKSLRSNRLITSHSAQISYISPSTLPRKSTQISSSSSSYSHDLICQGSRTDEQWIHTSSGLDSARNAEFSPASKPPKNGMSGIPSRKTSGNSNSVPRPPKMHTLSTAQRVVDGCEKSIIKKGDLNKMPQLRRGATTLGMVSVPHSSSETKWGNASQTTGSLKFSSLGKRANGHKGSMLPKSGSMSPPAPPVRKSSLDQKTRIMLSPSALKSVGNDGTRSSSPRSSVSEENFDVRVRGESFSFKSSSLRTASSLRSHSGKEDNERHFGSLVSLERCDSLTSVGSKPGTSRENSNVSISSTGKSGKMVPKLGTPSSISIPATTSLPSTTGISKLGQLKASITPRAIVGNGNKAKALSITGSKSLSSSTKILAVSAARNTSLPPTGKAPTRSVTGSNGKPGRGTIMGTKQAIRAANSRVSELAVGSSKKHLRGSDPADGNNNARTASEKPLAAPLPSPYSKITAPRHPQRYSSGHGSDNSSVLSGELPPAMGRTALFYHSGGSSGYESMIRDSETTGSASSAHDSMSESGVSTSSRTKASKSPKKRSNGLQRRRLIPAPLPDTSSLGRKVGAAGQWVDLPPLGGTMKEPFEIKVYEIDDVERFQRRKEGLTEGLQYFSTRLRMLEKRQQQIRELRVKHDKLKKELEDAKTRLMMDPSKWMGEFDVDPDLDQESLDYIEALAQATGELEFCVNLCKSRVMMETCFDIAVPIIPGQSGQLEMEV
ncbi:kinesin-like protein KIF26A isoform X2 [Myxocyprinus asiaticus]|uniref:kinesin-like protein KIF26A isoform X2 n=1 Tax=Myxocyprinus asiaticus TaxID=70543 RepID=UPI002221C900|nr:kinesin-like protein KIF26A isoform X2 [Myxocyprinus asiaticus]